MISEEQVRALHHQLRATNEYLIDLNQQMRDIVRDYCFGCRHKKICWTTHFSMLTWVGDECLEREEASHD
jgi:hypothetical protein